MSWQKCPSGQSQELANTHSSIISGNGTSEPVQAKFTIESTLVGEF